MNAVAMTLKFRLIGLFALFLALAAAGGAAVMVVNAQSAVRAEMLSALELAVALVQQSEQVDADRINGLGLRHVRARRDGGETTPHHQADDAPEWFAALIGVEPIELRITRADGGPAVVLTAEPHDEVAEVWEDMAALGLVTLGLCVAMIAALALAVDRALRPLAAFERGLDRLAAGDYAFRLNPGGPPELGRLGRGIAALAGALTAAQEENRRLARRLVAAQDDERRQLAGDLHDELGATLFGVKVDAGRILQLSSDRADAADAARRVLEAADHLNQLGRSVMIRLRPPLLDQLSLSEALSELVDAARRRRPELRWRLDLDGPLDTLEDSLALTVYRLAQEGVTNAQRHGEPTRIEVAVAVDPAAGRVEVAVRDDGRGLAATPQGFGLAGLAERVQLLGGRLAVAAATQGGVELTATLPLIGEKAASVETTGAKMEERT